MESDSEHLQVLQGRLAHLHRELDRRRAKLVGATSAYGGFGGIEPQHLDEINRRIAKGQGIDALADEIRELEEQLDEAAE